MKKLIVALSMMILAQTSVADISQPRYIVIEKQGQLEIRRYQPQVLAMTSYTPQLGEERRNAFMRLFAYINGENANEAKIAMTAPVLSWQANDKVWMAFVMPEETVRSGTPSPLNEKVSLKATPHQLIATNTYRWQNNTNRMLRKTQELERWLFLEDKYSAVSQVIYAGYDRPGTRPAKQRHEVMFVVQQKN